MKLIANSLIEHDGEVYHPGVLLPDVDEATQEIWISKGLAVQRNDPDDEPPVTGHLDPEQLGTMTIAQLKKLAEDIGADTKACKVKDDYVQAIAAVEVEAPANEAPEDGSDV